MSSSSCMSDASSIPAATSLSNRSNASLSDFGDSVEQQQMYLASQTTISPAAAAASSLSPYDSSADQYGSLSRSIGTTVEPSNSTGPSSSYAAAMPPLDPTIEAQQWYFYDITREQVTRLMMGKSDGTFLVRDSTSRASTVHSGAINNASNVPALDAYTLTLRNGGSNKLIKIYYSNSNGRFGFAEPYEFTTVHDLIQHHFTTSLARYNRTLDVCLKYPLSRRSEFDTKTTEDAIQLLKLINIDYIMTSDVYDKCYEEHEQLKQQLQVKRQALDAFDHTIQMYEDQLSLARSMSKNVVSISTPAAAATAAAPAGTGTPSVANTNFDTNSTSAALKRNEEILLYKISGMRNSKQQTMDTVRLEQMQQHNKAMQMRTMEPKIMRLFKQREDLSKVLHTQRGLHIDVINTHLQDASRQAQIETAKKFGLVSGVNGVPASPSQSQQQLAAQSDSNTTPEVDTNVRTYFGAKDPYHQYEHSLQYQQTPPPQYHQHQHAGPNSATGMNGEIAYQVEHQMPASGGGVAIPAAPSRSRTTTISHPGSYPVQPLPPPYTELPRSPQQHQQQHPLHADADNWYFGLQCSRQQSQALLLGKPQGTFLIRKRAGEPSEGTHALSIVDQSGVQIHHAIIYENPSAGTFGFLPSTAAEELPLAVLQSDIKFNSLKDMVMYYADRTLEEHNPALKVAMLHPALAPMQTATPAAINGSPPPAYHQLQHHHQVGSLGAAAPQQQHHHAAFLSSPPSPSLHAAAVAAAGVGGSVSHRPNIQQQHQQSAPDAGVRRPPPPHGANISDNNKVAELGENTTASETGPGGSRLSSPLHAADDDFLFSIDAENDDQQQDYDDLKDERDYGNKYSVDAESSEISIVAGNSPALGSTSDHQLSESRQQRFLLAPSTSAGFSMSSCSSSSSSSAGSVESHTSPGKQHNKNRHASSPAPASSLQQQPPPAMAARGDSGKTTPNMAGITSKKISTSPSTSSVAGSSSLLSSSLSSTSTITSTSTQRKTNK